MINIDFTEKVVVVTGGAQGIGKAIVEDFAKAGAKIVIADILEARGEVLAEDLQRKRGSETIYFKKTDITNSEDIKNALVFAYTNLGSIDVLINNAAVNIPGDIIELPEESWDKTMDVNVKSQYLVSKYAIPYMSEKAVIINMASANSFLAEPRLSAYVTSKGAIKMLTQSMAIDLAPRNIRVNCICPGFVDTTFNDAHAKLFGGREEILKDIDKIHLIGRPIEPEEIAKVALFLASDLSSCITGASILADGGITAGAW